MASPIARDTLDRSSDSSASDCQRKACSRTAPAGHSPDSPAGPATARVLVAGVGLVSPLGRSAWETFTALDAGQTLPDRADRLPAGLDPAHLVRALGSSSVAQHAGTDPAVELAERAAREALFAAGLEPAGVPTFVGTSKGAIRAWSRAAHAADRGSLEPELAAAIALGPGALFNVELRRRLHVAPRSHHIAACASSLAALDAARYALLHRTLPDDADACLVVTAESALDDVFIHSYRRLGVLAPLPPASEPYRAYPLDARRGGFMLSELAAAIVLRRVPADQPPMPGELELLRTAVATEPHDLIRAAPRMGTLHEVARRLFDGEPVDVLHPHAPGTADHDAGELSALWEACEATRSGKAAGASGHGPDVYAVKGALGHGLGAAGLVSLVIAAVCSHARRRPPMPWLDEPIDARLSRKGRDLGPATSHAVFAAGFGGHVAGALVRRH